MNRQLFLAAVISGTAISMAPTAAADPPRYDGDVPGMSYDASMGAPCDNYERFIFGRTAQGQVEACHFITHQFPAAETGYWVISYPLHGVQEVGAPCANPRGSAAQSPDGYPMMCTEHGWQIGQLTNGGFPLQSGGFPSDTGITTDNPNP